MFYMHIVEMNYFLEGKELDIFIPMLSLAIEVNGQYHYGLDPLYP